MQESSHPAPSAPRSTPESGYVRELEDGGALVLEGATVTDPDTGRPVPAATLHLPAWRLRDVSRALRGWSVTAAQFAMSADWPPDESDLADALATTADLLDHPDPIGTAGTTTTPPSTQAGE